VLPEVTATRYVTPLREGGSLPGLMEADDLGTYVVKFHGAGQGRKTLVAEVICSRLARGLGLDTPDLAVVDVDPGLAPYEPDEEVQDLLRASPGANLGVDYLPGALDVDARAVDQVLAARILWFDALIGNVDRSWRNPNMLLWHGRVHLIDHGAALIFHHSWANLEASASRLYDAATHALAGTGPDVDVADAELAPLVGTDLVEAAVADVPEGWLADEPGFASTDAVRAAYVGQLTARVAARESWLPSLRSLRHEAAS
jgi:hypothetical protein